MVLLLDFHGMSLSTATNRNGFLLEDLHFIDLCIISNYVLLVKYVF